MNDLITWTIAHSGDILAIITGVIATASVIVKLTPTEVDNAWLAKIAKVTEWLALNKDKLKK